MNKKPCYLCGGRGLRFVPDTQSGQYNLEECKKCGGTGSIPQRYKINKRDMRKMDKEHTNKKFKRVSHARSY